MRNIGLLLLAVSLLLGGISVWGLRQLGSAQAKPSAPQPSFTSVAVAARPIAFGEKITPAMVRIDAWPNSKAPVGSFRSAAELTSGGSRAAMGPIAAGEPFMAQELSGPGGRVSLATVLRPGMRAAAIRVDDVQGVAGFILPGHSVDVLVTRTEGGDHNTMRTDLLVQNLRVLAVDQDSDQTKNHPVLAKTTTVEVTPIQAEKLALAGQIGSLSLALRPPVDDAQVALATMRITDLGLSQPAARARRIPAARGGAAAQVHEARIQVYRGADVSNVGVPQE